MAQSKIETLTEKRNQIDAQIQALKAQEVAQKRKDDTRKKILIGGVVLKMLKAKDLKQEWLDGILNKHLDSERDRALFGLAPQKEGASRPKPAASSTPSQEH